MKDAHFLITKRFWIVKIINDIFQDSSQKLWSDYNYEIMIYQMIKIVITKPKNRFENILFIMLKLIRLIK